MNHEAHQARSQGTSHERTEPKIRSTAVLGFRRTSYVLLLSARCAKYTISKRYLPLVGAYIVSLCYGELLPQLFDGEILIQLSHSEALCSALALSPQAVTFPGVACCLEKRCRCLIVFLHRF